MTNEEYFSGKKCQFPPCENDAIGTVSDEHMGWRACAECVVRLKLKGWKLWPEYERDPNRPGFLREKAVQ